MAPPGPEEIGYALSREMQARFELVNVVLVFMQDLNVFRESI
jgi:hypothetical protein